MSDDFKIEDATRAGVRELIGLFGMSSGGKTRSALILARGIVGPAGRIGVIDTENRRASYFVDCPPGPACPGKFKVINFGPPFTPERYMKALKTFEKDADIVVVDSMTHEWSGEGGVLDMHEAALDRMLGEQDRDNYGKRERLNWPAWRNPKMEHKAFTMYVLRYPLPLILCFRGKTITKMQKVDNKNTVVTEPHPGLDFDSQLIFDMLVAGEVYRDADKDRSGLLRVTKVSREELLTCLPKKEEQITIEHGARLHAWCEGQAIKPAGAQPTTAGKKPLSARDAKAQELWTLTQSKHQGDKRILEQWLWDEGIISDTESLAGLIEQRLTEVLAKAREKLQPTTQGTMI